MNHHDPRVDAYIAKSADFARPILQHIRSTVHTACPDVQERIKWGFPHFDYQDAMMCSMAAFKHHCSLGFWMHKQVVGTETVEGMGSFGRIVSIKDLPGKRDLTAYIKKAMAVNEAGIKKERPKTASKPPPDMPADLALLLKKNISARHTYEAFKASCQREYVDWINEAKTDSTRQKRLATTVEWLAQGKRRNWKYLA